MTPITRFLRFWYDFLVGDDWTVPVGVVLALGVTALLVIGDVPAWWLVPVAVVALLGVSLRRATRGA
ncbi:hypothetical protein [Streptomyces sp. TP-A0356]|uniref:hypothetical protein n=1 Tax=Streptomyces sp. TP-A0356 TaxID=1359208 RepID=UPI0006E3746D|nr:hypothetical protein [Streptomyces sp. TP-A0356]